MIAAARRYICDYTGRDEAWVDAREDLWAVVMVIVRTGSRSSGSNLPGGMPGDLPPRNR